jgi:hypothetical protein
MRKVVVRGSVALSKPGAHNLTQPTAIVTGKHGDNKELEPAELDDGSCAG